MPSYPLINLNRRLDTEDTIIRNPFPGRENAHDSLITLLTGGAEASKSDVMDDQDIPSGYVLFAELFRNVKDSLDKIRSFVHLSRERFESPEYGDYFCKTIAEDIAKTDAVLNCLANYLKINSPLPRANTVRLILEEILKYYEDALRNKKIKVIKRQFEESLPETSLHEEHLRFILNSILQYAVPSIPPQGSIGFITRSLEAREGTDGGKFPPQKGESYVEILTGFTGCQNGSQPSEPLSVNPLPPQKESDDFILLLAEEIIKMNRGRMEIRVDDEKLITTISLILPTERRMTSHYQSTTA